MNVGSLGASVRNEKHDLASCTWQSTVEHLMGGARLGQRQDSTDGGLELAGVYQPGKARQIRTGNLRDEEDCAKAAARRFSLVRRRHGRHDTTSGLYKFKQKRLRLTADCVERRVCTVRELP